VEEWTIVSRDDAFEADCILQFGPVEPLVKRGNQTAKECRRTL
jgi:hypothetical protein